MSSPRLLVAAAMALACAVVPSTASATLTPYGGDSTATPDGYGTVVDANGQVKPKWTADGILAPGDAVNLDFPLSDDGDPVFNGGQGQLFPVGNFANGTVETAVKAFPAATGGVTTNASPYAVTVGSNVVCGTRLGLRLAIGSTTNLPYGLPTGVEGSYRRTRSYDIGNIIPEEGSKESKVSIVRGADIAKGLRVHIDQITHQYSTYWTKIELKSPSGKTITLIEDKGRTAQEGSPTKSFTNVTFSDYPVAGQAPITGSSAIQSDFKDVVIRPQTSFAAFDGENLTGDWKLIVSDKAAPLQNRSGGRGRTALAGKDMIELGGWQLDTAGALCTGAPEAWFGDDPLVLSPAGDVLNGGASHDPTLGGSIVKYEWDLDGNSSNGFETTTAMATTALPPSPGFDGKRDISLRVTDNQGNVSPIVTRSAVITTPPTIDSITVNPATPIADQTVTITGVAHDTETPNGITYSWDLDDDGVYGDKSGPQITNAWSQSGSKVIRLKVTDGAGASTYLNKAIKIANTAPVARAKAITVPAIVGAEVTLTGAESTDVDGTIAKYSWDLNGDGTYGDVVSTTDPTVKTVFDRPGVSFVGLEVTDNTGGVSEDFVLQVIVTSLPQGKITATPASPLVGETVQYDAAGSADTDPGGSIVKYEWDLDGNGSFEVSGPTATTASKSYPNAGQVNVKLRLTDNDGAVSITPLALLVRSPGGTGGTGGTGGSTGGTKPGGATGGTGGSSGGTPVEGGKTSVPGVGVVAAGVDASLKDNPFLIEDGDEVTDGGILNGFSAKISAGAKLKAAKAIKNGVSVAVATSDPGTIVVKAMISVKDAKKIGLKIKKPTAIGSGKLVIKKKGKAKFVVKFAKKYAKYVKKTKKTPVTLVGVATFSDGTAIQMARKVVISK